MMNYLSKSKGFKNNKILNQSRQLIRTSTQKLKKRKGPAYSEYISKNHSRNSSYHKNSKCKSRKKQKSKCDDVLEKLLFIEYDSKTNKKSRQVKIIPQAIQYKDINNQVKNSRLLRKNKKMTLKPFQSSENKQNQMNQFNRTSQNFILNKQLLKASLKPNKVNYMNRISNIYDLVISRVMLPSFVQYFLGEALYIINKQSKVLGVFSSDGVYDWRLDQFKKVCQKIYQFSEQEDLKHFMSLSLPTISRWNSKISTVKNTSAIPSNTFITTHEDSRVSGGLSSYSCTNNNNRIGYFRSLNRKERFSIGQEKQSIDIIDKLNNKLDSYLKNNYNKIEPEKKDKESKLDFLLKKQRKIEIGCQSAKENYLKQNL